MKAVGIVASPRPDGNTAWAVRRALECVEHLAIGGCRRDAALDARPEALAAALAAGRRLAEGRGGMVDG